MQVHAGSYLEKLGKQHELPFSDKRVIQFFLILVALNELQNFRTK
jgi:hypothetical protein